MSSRVAPPAPPLARSRSRPRCPRLAPGRVRAAAASSHAADDPSSSASLAAPPSSSSSASSSTGSSSSTPPTSPSPSPSPLTTTAPRRHNRRGDNAERDAYADALRLDHGVPRVTKRDWRSHVGRLRDPPAALRDVAVVLVGTKKAGNVGAVARACGAFECEDLRLVAPRADPYTRASLSAAKGAQHILRGAGVYDTLEDALLDAGKAVAFHVWIEGFDDDASSSRASESEASEASSSGTFRGRASALETVRDLDELMRRYPPERTNVRSAERRSARDEATEDPTDEDAFEWIANAERERVLLSSAGEARQLPTDPTDDARATAEEGASSKNKTQTQTPGPWRVRTHRTPPANRSHRGAGKLALVFGREVEGLADREVRLCDAACAIPTGRVIESLSVSHAAVISLSRYFEESQRRRRRATTTAGEGEEEEERAEEGGGGGGAEEGVY